MRKPLIASATLHVALVALFVLGMPPSDRTLEIPASVPIEIVDVSELTQMARIDQGEPRPTPPAPKPPTPEAKPAAPPPEPVAEAPPPPPPPPPPREPEPPKLVEPPPPPRPTPAPPPPPPPPPPPDPEPAPTPKPPPPPPPPEPPKPQPLKPEPPKPEPPKEQPKPEPPKEQPKPEPPKPQPPKEQPPKEQPKAEPKPEPAKEQPKKPPPKEVAKADPLSDLLDSVDKIKPSTPAKSDAKSEAKPTQTAQAPSGAAKAIAGPDKPFKPSGRAIGAIAGQVGKNWNFDPGRKDSASMQLEIRIEVARDRRVLNAYIDEKYRSRYQSDSAFRAAADAAVRAVKRSSPLDLLPEEFTDRNYEQWRYIVFTFDPRDMF